MSEPKPRSLGDIWKRERGITFFKKDPEFERFNQNLPEPMRGRAKDIWKAIQKDLAPADTSAKEIVVNQAGREAVSNIPALRNALEYVRSFLVANPRVGIVVTIFFLCAVLWAVAGPIERLVLPEQYWSMRVAKLEAGVAVIRSAMYRNVVGINVATDNLQRGLLTPEDYKQAINDARHAVQTLQPDLREREEELQEARRKLAGARR